MLFSEQQQKTLFKYHIDDTYESKTDRLFIGCYIYTFLKQMAHLSFVLNVNCFTS